MNLDLLLSKIGISQNFVQDFTLLLVVAILTVAVAFLVGRHRLIQSLVGIYISLALLQAFPEKYLNDYSFELIFFFVALVLVTISSKKIFGIYISGAEFMWRIFVMSFLEVVLLLSVVFTITPKKIVLGYISPNAYDYLVSPIFHFSWMFIPLLFVYLIRKRLN
ncbi:MAG: hypothetical protein Q7U36_04460 [bacterium]|nr:hypothetical protein [bacterium]